MSPVEGIEFAVDATIFLIEITHPLSCSVQCGLGTVALGFGEFFFLSLATTIFPFTHR